MAVVHKSKSALRRKKNIFLFSSFGLIFLTIVYCLLFMFAHIKNIFFISPIFFFGISILFLLNRYSIIRFGLSGEESALKLVKTLPSNYHIFSDIRVSYDGNKGEIDLLVIGNNGVFIVEVKNHNGQICGKEEDKHWIQRKVGKHGGHYSKKFYNPTKQVRTHIFKLSNEFRDRHIHVWSEGIVFFSNPKVEVNVDTDKIPVFTDRKLIDFIINYKPRDYLKDDELLYLVDFIKSKK